MQELNDVMPAPRQAVVLPVLQYPNPMLSQVSRPIVSDIVTDKALQTLLDDMVMTMRQTGAVGLAAVQVGQPVRALVVRSGNNFIKVINPRITHASQAQVTTKEGCLSFFGLFINVRRAASVTIEYFDEQGKPQSTSGDALLARAIQHEIDHLDGKTFLDRVGAVERSEALRKQRLAQRKVKQAIKALKR
jgi:peptide deformylase